MAKEAIIVTGAAGLLGGRIAARFHRQGQTVIGMDRRRPAVTPFGFVVADVNDVHRLYAATRSYRVAGIVHCGGISGFMVAKDDPFLVCETNVRGTYQILEAARALEARRVVFCSAIMVYGNQKAKTLKETARLMPLNVYAASKAASEQLVNAYAEQFGFDGVSLRISHVYGPGRETECFIRQMIEDKLGGRPTRLSQSRRSRRQYVYVDDVVEAIALAFGARRLKSRAYNITAGEEHSLADVARIADRVLGGIDVDFDDANDPPSYRVAKLDIAAARADLGYRPKIKLDAGIALYAQWLRRGGAGSGA